MVGLDWLEEGSLLKVRGISFLLDNVAINIFKFVTGRRSYRMAAEFDESFNWFTRIINVH